MSMEPISTPLHLENTHPPYLSPIETIGGCSEKFPFGRAFVTRGGVILVKREPQLHWMMCFEVKSSCRRGDIYQVRPFPAFLLSRVYQLLSKLTREHFPPLCDLKKSKMVSVSFSHCHKFPYYYGFEQCCTCAQVSAKFDSTPPIAYPLSPNYSNHCIYP